MCIPSLDSTSHQLPKMSPTIYVAVEPMPIKPFCQFRTRVFPRFIFAKFRKLSPLDAEGAIFELQKGSRGFPQIPPKYRSRSGCMRMSGRYLGSIEIPRSMDPASSTHGGTPKPHPKWYGGIRIQYADFHTCRYCLAKEGALFQFLHSQISELNTRAMAEEPNVSRGARKPWMLL